MVNNTTDVITDPGIPLTQFNTETVLISSFIIAIIAAIIFVSLWKWAPEYIKLSPANRPNLLNYITVLVIILAIIIFGLTKNIDSEAITTLLGAIAGYVFGVTTDPKLLSSRGLDNKPFAQINAETKGKVGNQLFLDGSSSVDPSGNPLKEYMWIMKTPPGSNAALEKSETINPILTPDMPGTYTIILIVNNGTQYSDPAKHQIDVSEG